MSKMNEQKVKVYVAGMAQHVKEAQQAMQAEVNDGWHIDHVASLSSGLLLVVYSYRGGGVVDERRFSGPGVR